METLESIRAPLEAYNYWPEAHRIFTGTNYSIARSIFYKVPFSQFESSKLAEFKKRIPSALKSRELPVSCTDEELLRILCSCGFNVSQALCGLVHALDWREVHSPQYSSVATEQLLGSGAVYLHGRDSKFRPILIVNLGRFDFECHLFADYQALLCFYLELIVKHMLVLGQIENWVVLVDLACLNFKHTPRSELKKLVKTMQSLHRCRLAGLYILNAPRNFCTTWKTVSKYIATRTLSRIRISEDQKLEDVRSHFASGQVETKYGGCAPDCTVFWPPTMPPGPFLQNEEHSSGNDSAYTKLVESTGDCIFSCGLDKENQLSLRARDSFVSMSILTPSSRRRHDGVTVEAVELSTGPFCGCRASSCIMF